MAEGRPRAPRKTIREFEREIDELAAGKAPLADLAPAFARTLSSFLDGAAVTVHLYEEEGAEFVLRGTTHHLHFDGDTLRFGADGTLPGLALAERRIVSLAEEQGAGGRAGRAEEHVFPLSAGGRAIGAVTVTKIAAERLSALRLDRARRGTLRFAEVLGRIREEEAQARRLNRLAAINEFGVVLVSARSVEEVPELATAMTSFILATEGCLLRLRDEAGGSSVRDAHGLRDPASSREILRLEELASRETLLAGRPLLVRDTAAHERYRGFSPRVRSFVCQPLGADGEPLGTLTVFNKDPESPLASARFGREDLDALLHIARYVERAVANARLFSRSRELAQRDELTGLPDRAGFRARLLTEVGRARRFRLRIGLVTCEVRTAAGGKEADTGPALQRFARAICGALRDYDTVARIAEGTFGILLPQVQNGASSPIGRIRAAILREAERQRGAPGESELDVRFSYAVFPDDGASGEAVLAHLERQG